ncbi:cyanophycinase [Paracoccus benzoatiresistens]|uniref:Cyanophycinase n=1 Tax=Paracoccus benzoatiresistens TaxID=2997341 RepID=A0ABT4J3T4_9RHOB|nr:cyanophycinase [Paracoccus sp. EF6]MCZ0961046.1 cyanophycinase [Paracoccus sp. EF6]
MLLRLFAAAAALPAWAGSQPRADGALVAIGGGAKAGIYADVLQLYGRPAPRILVIPQAAPAADLEGAVEDSRKLFAESGADGVEGLDLSRIDQARAQIAGADIIWMSGGRQGRLANALRQAGLVEDIRLRFAARRGIIAGTSAGASIMSHIMIETSRRDAAGTRHPILARGLGLWPEAIIDQHFSQRGRLQRLTRAIERHPDLIGIGIDEDTGFVRFGDGSTRVIGTGTVTIVRAVSHSPITTEATRLHRDRILEPL